MPYTVGDAMHNRGVITCQSFGLDEKITDVSRCFFLVGVTGFDATLLVALSSGIALGHKAKNSPLDYFLYALSLLEVRILSTNNAKTKEHFAVLFVFGRSDRIRTCGIDVPNVARYQLRHTPFYLCFSIVYYFGRIVKIKRGDF